MSSYGRSKKNDWLKTFSYIAIYLAVLGLSSPYLIPSYWYAWVLLVVGGLILLVLWHTKTSAYHCPRCSYEFEISMLTDFLSPQGVDAQGGWKYLKCPRCSNRTRMTVLEKRREK